MTPKATCLQNFLYLCVVLSALIKLSKVFENSICKMNMRIFVLLLFFTFSGTLISRGDTTVLPDSMLSYIKAREIFYTDSETAHKIIRTMRERQMEPEWKLDMYEGNLYYMGRLFRHALVCHKKALQDKAVDNNPQAKIRLLRHLMDDCDYLRLRKELLETYLELDELARKHNDLTYMALARFMRGKNKCSQGDKEEGYRMCLEAVEMMKRSDFQYKYKELTTFYANLARLYRADGRYEDALRMSEAQEQSILEDKALNNETARLRTLRRLYAIRASILAKQGRIDEADSVYELCKATGVKDPIVARDLTEFLMERGQYADALDVLNFVENALRQDGDTVCVPFLRICCYKAEAQRGLQDYEGAASCYAVAAAMSDSINIQASRELAASTIDLLEHKYYLAQRKWWITTAIGSTAVLMLICIVLLVYNRIINHHNKTMSATLNKMLYYRQSALQNEKHLSDETEENATSDADREALARFREIDRRITQEELFRDPSFGRDDLVRLAGIDKNRLPAFIQQFANTNVVGYINSKRMEYAADMMKRHPDYTLNAIAEACGIKSPATFIRNFKAAYGMAPSDFRKNIDGIYPPLVSQNDG